jgi:hypothetical protein
MAAICPAGHRSEATDYCDRCGLRLDGVASPVPVERETAASALLGPCPACGALRAHDDRFCESCGYDLVAAPPLADAGEPGRTTREWEAVVSPDRQRFTRFARDGLAFPAAVAARRIALDKPQVVIGRRRAGDRGEAPDIDLGGAFEDPAVSRRHAALVRQADGSYAVVDLDSTNGTTLNDDPAPLAANVVTPLADGDRVGVGAWTTVTLRRRST